MNLDVAFGVNTTPTVPGIAVGHSGAVSFHVHIKHTLCVQAAWRNGKVICCLTGAPTVDSCLAQLNRVAEHTGVHDVNFKLKKLTNYIGESNV